MRKIIFSLIVITISLGQVAYAQQSAQFSQYMYYGLMLNPAYSGLDDGIRVQATHRTQYAGYQASNPNTSKGGSQGTQLLSANGTLPQNMGGVGLYVINDKLGPLGYTQIMASYAYHLPLAGGRLSAGISGGYFTRSLDGSMFYAADNSDPNLDRSIKTAGAFDAGVGIWYKHEKYYVGLSSQHLVPSSLNLAGRSTFKQARTIYLTAGYNFQVKEDLKITPSLLYKMEGGSTSIDLSGMATYANEYFAGLSYRSGFAGPGYTTESLILLAGINLLKNNTLRLCYSLDSPWLLGNANALAATSHEIQLSYLLPTIPVNPRPIIRTPRYRK